MSTKVKIAGSELLQTVFACLYGLPKVGKSSFLSSVPSMLVGDVDGAAQKCRHMRAAGTAFMPVTSEEDMIDFLAEGADPKWHAVAVDTLSYWSQVQADAIRAELGPEEVARNKYLQWEILTRKIRALIAGLKSLNKHVILTAHPGVDKDESTGKMYGQIDLAGRKSESFIHRLVDEMWFMSSAVRIDDKGNEQIDRYIHSAPYGLWIAGSRLGLPAKIGPNPVWADILSALGMPPQAENGGSKKRSKR